VPSSALPTPARSNGIWRRLPGWICTSSPRS